MEQQPLHGLRKFCGPHPDPIFQGVPLGLQRPFGLLPPADFVFQGVEGRAPEGDPQRQGEQSRQHSGNARDPEGDIERFLGAPVELLPKLQHEEALPSRYHLQCLAIDGAVPPRALIVQQFEPVGHDGTQGDDVPLFPDPPGQDLGHRAQTMLQQRGLHHAADQLELLTRLDARLPDDSLPLVQEGTGGSHHREERDDQQNAEEDAGSSEPEGGGHRLSSPVSPACSRSLRIVRTAR